LLVKQWFTPTLGVEHLFMLIVNDIVYDIAIA